MEEEASSPKQVHVVKSDRVAEALENLRHMKIHRHFVGYLCARRNAHLQESPNNFRLKYNQFYDRFLKVSGSPSGQPYMHIFVEHDPSPHNKWLNENLAGSYAPSSLREGSPLLRTISIESDGRNSRYSLIDKHWKNAREHLAYGEEIPVVELSVVLYRDFGLKTTSPSVFHLTDAFKHEFGYLDGSGEETDEFDYLYRGESATSSLQNWFEPFND